MRLAVIPARGGSKRIPHKNIREFCGKPMIAWSIEAAQEADCFDQIIVSTDDQSIAEISQEFGADVPFVRPAELADDHCGIAQVIAHAIGAFSVEGQDVNAVCCILATAPMISAQDLQMGLSVLDAGEVDFAFSVASYPFPIQRALRLVEEDKIAMIQPKHAQTRSQDLEETFHDAGQFYWGTAIAWREGRAIFSQQSAPIIVPRYRVQDIDTPEDWQRAEAMMLAVRETARAKAKKGA
ncbi:pseudaminic acid cytidylyltransferase [Qipengyuania sp. DGS5-3]|uniref:pseudaminic acid cytidylyltransferase n=1 Tax=Qipengyuania sp. DGS5-3 TaxID=3349632 RepID=UPI0036D3736D